MDRQPTALVENGAEAECPTAPPAGIFARIFTRHFFYVALLAALPIAFGEGLNSRLTLLRDPDIWWHLADARLLLSTGHFIRFEPYSFTVAGQPWINPEWLAELPYWLSYHALGLRGIYLVTWLAICANVLSRLLARLSRHAQCRRGLLVCRHRVCSDGGQRRAPHHRIWLCRAFDRDADSRNGRHGEAASCCGFCRHSFASG